METFAKIIESLAWPVTTIIVVLLLRKPLTELVPTLKKLKYKDLELEFEREANKILSEAERDLPELTEKPHVKVDVSTAQFSRQQLEPAVEIIKSWREFELYLREVSASRKLKPAPSIRSLVSELENIGAISKEAGRVIMDLAALRNKVVHTDEEAITYETSLAFIKSVNQVRSSMKFQDV